MDGTKQRVSSIKPPSAPPGHYDAIRQQNIARNKAFIASLTGLPDTANSAKSSIAEEHEGKRSKRPRNAQSDPTSDRNPCVGITPQGLDRLGSRWLARGPQFQQLAGLMGGAAEPCVPIIVQGPPCTGKSGAIRDVLEESSCPYTLVDCKQALSLRQLMQAVVEQLVSSKRLKLAPAVLRQAQRSIGALSSRDGAAAAGTGKGRAKRKAREPAERRGGDEGDISADDWCGAAPDGGEGEVDSDGERGGGGYLHAADAAAAAARQGAPAESRQLRSLGVTSNWQTFIAVLDAVLSNAAEEAQRRGGAAAGAQRSSSGGGQGVTVKLYMAFDSVEVLLLSATAAVEVLLCPSAAAAWRVGGTEDDDGGSSVLLKLLLLQGSLARAQAARADSSAQAAPDSIAQSMSDGSAQPAWDGSAQAAGGSAAAWGGGGGGGRSGGGGGWGAPRYCVVPVLVTERAGLAQRQLRRGHMSLAQYIAPVHIHFPAYTPEQAKAILVQRFRQKGALCGPLPPPPLHQELYSYFVTAMVAVTRGATNNLRDLDRISQQLWPRYLELYYAKRAQAAALTSADAADRNGSAPQLQSTATAPPSTATAPQPPSAATATQPPLSSATAPAAASAAAALQESSTAVVPQPTRTGIAPQESTTEPAPHDPRTKLKRSNELAREALRTAAAWLLARKAAAPQPQSAAAAPQWPGAAAASQLPSAAAAPQSTAAAPQRLSGAAVVLLPLSTAIKLRLPSTAIAPQPASAATAPPAPSTAAASQPASAATALLRPCDVAPALYEGMRKLLTSSMQHFYRVEYGRNGLAHQFGQLWPPGTPVEYGRNGLAHQFGQLWPPGAHTEGATTPHATVAAAAAPPAPYVYAPVHSSTGLSETASVLLVAAFLAAHIPASSDITLYTPKSNLGRRGSKRRKSAEGAGGGGGGGGGGGAASKVTRLLHAHVLFIDFLAGRTTATCTCTNIHRGVRRGDTPAEGVGSGGGGGGGGGSASAGGSKPSVAADAAGSFPLERLTAIYASLRGAQGLAAADSERTGTIVLYGHVASLVALRLLSACGDGADLSALRYRCHAGLDLARRAARAAALDLDLYLQNAPAPRL
ncbi:origin recognition complex subunit 5 C-terminus-domain-containing protein [Tribonema minus]|uniref:Origin recognition complex subunit 5 C-terminus-domain-containing protein n=1 Tax=Tribonema minus TaxID=303371 RepID=A0A836CAU5_9STRA|nr:origin recognition complex subunit 5 C-terminus-domain-containing protein [Tribonema minus]